MPEIAGWVVFGLVSAICAALVAIFGKLGLAEVSPIPATVARAIVMAAVTSLAAIAVISESSPASIGRAGPSVPGSWSRARS